jgi:hypothetical protein
VAWQTPSSPATTPPQEQTPEAEELGAVVVAAVRRGRRVRLDASATLLVRAGHGVDPSGWSWRIARQRNALAAWRTAVVTLTGRELAARTIRARVAVSGSAGVLADALVRLPSAASRRLMLRIPAATLASERLRAAVVDRARRVAVRRELRALPRTLAALERSLELLDARGRQVIVRLRVSTPRQAPWLARLERLSARRLERALGGRPIALAPFVRLTILHAPAASRVSITFATSKAPVR